MNLGHDLNAGRGLNAGHNRYAALGWCRNPFGSLTPDEAAAAAVVDISGLQSQLARPRHAVQIIARRGRGKTTHLQAFEHHVRHTADLDAVYVYFPQRFAGLNRRPVVPKAGVVILDEAQRMPRDIARRIIATGVPLLLGTHRSLRRRLHHGGYNVRTIRLGGTSDPAVTAEIVRRRLRLATPDAATIGLTDDEAAILHRRYAGHHRAMIQYLYDRVEMLAAIVPSGLANDGQSPGRFPLNHRIDAPMRLVDHDR